MLLGDNNDQVLREAKEVAQLRGGVQLAALSFYLGVSLGKAETLEELGWGKKRGWGCCSVLALYTHTRVRELLFPISLPESPVISKL